MYPYSRKHSRHRRPRADRPRVRTRTVYRTREVEGPLADVVDQLLVAIEDAEGERSTEENDVEAIGPWRAGQRKVAAGYRRVLEQVRRLRVAADAAIYDEQAAADGSPPDWLVERIAELRRELAEERREHRERRDREREEVLVEAAAWQARRSAALFGPPHPRADLLRSLALGEVDADVLSVSAVEQAVIEAIERLLAAEAEAL